MRYPLQSKIGYRLSVLNDIYFIYMEGTKHEKALLVVLSYIVGLTSGFIAFGLTQSNQILETTDVVSSYEGESQLVATTEENSVEETPVSSGVKVTYDDGRLTVDVNGSIQLLSVERSRLNLEAASYFTKQGTHSIEPVYKLSPDSKYVFFCEQDTTTDSCQSFVYDIQNEMIHYVTNNGTKLALSRDEAKQVVWDGLVLVAGLNTSNSSESPWLLSTK